MDIAHHAAIGFAGAMAISALDAPLAASVFLMASVFPDFDVVAIAKGKLSYLMHHQTASHSLVTTSLVSLLVVFLSSYAFSLPESLAAGAAFFASVLIHVLLDASNTLGTELLWPYRRRWRADAVFFIDALSWALTLSVLYALWRTEAAWPFAVYLLVMTGQIAIRAVMSRRAKNATGYAISIPDPVVPWVYHLTRPNADGSTDLVSWSALRGVIRGSSKHVDAADSVAQDIAGTSDMVSKMMGFARAFTIVSDKQTDEGQREIILRDVAMRRVGARFGEITLLMRSDGDIEERLNV